MSSIGVQAVTICSSSLNPSASAHRYQSSSGDITRQESDAPRVLQQSSASYSSKPGLTALAAGFLDRHLTLENASKYRMSLSAGESITR